MIAFLHGLLAFKNLDNACIDVGGVGYRVRMPLADLARLGSPGAKVQVHVHTHVREDALELFGFSSADGLALFEQLISVSGVGPKVALALLSGLEPAELVVAITSQDQARLTKVPGVGAKTAARLVLELKDRLRRQGGQAAPSRGNAVATDPVLDLRSALENLGYKPAQVERAAKAVEPMAKEGQALEVLVREALRHV
ncbi:MAG: Holliday junction branch migration protein RuvA [Myxococcota bacterium]